MCFCVVPHIFFRLAGRDDEHTGKDKAGIGRHQAASLLHTAVSAGKGLTPHQHETRAQETAGGNSGDEVSVILSVEIVLSCS